jgi:dephospho-CoA kinase
VTGGLSSGKSTVCRFLTELGAYFVSADEIVHSLLSTNEEVQRKVARLLGPEVMVQGQLNRQEISKKAFSEPKTLKSLELILHPLVFHEMELRYQTVKNNPSYKLFVAEVPLLYETKMEHLFDFVITVLASEDRCKKRFSDKSYFEERNSLQMPSQDKANRADFVLMNNSSLEDLKNEVAKIAVKLQSIQMQKGDFLINESRR